ncbi:bacterioferritin-associated ferredoxin [Balneola sp. MJW-20]|uniref:(2Fe-2S)-binding protein n=1 Tax=Gracilimonas aurantiaca TaxID=3234185 RepID=UPI0034660ABA
MSRFRVDKCICHKRSFEVIREYAEKEGIKSVSELQKQNICSTGCGLCIPYIELMLETGETSFEPGAPYKRKTG